MTTLSLLDLNQDHADSFTFLKSSNKHLVHLERRGWAKKLSVKVLDIIISYGWEMVKKMLDIVRVSMTGCAKPSDIDMLKMVASHIGMNVVKQIEGSNRFNNGNLFKAAFAISRKYLDMVFVRKPLDETTFEAARATLRHNLKALLNTKEFLDSDAAFMEYCNTEPPSEATGSVRTALFKTAADAFATKHPQNAAAVQDKLLELLEAEAPEHSAAEATTAAAPTVDPAPISHPKRTVAWSEDDDELPPVETMFTYMAKPQPVHDASADDARADGEDESTDGKLPLDGLETPAVAPMVDPAPVFDSAPIFPAAIVAKPRRKLLRPPPHLRLTDDEPIPKELGPFQGSLPFPLATTDSPRNLASVNVSDTSDMPKSETQESVDGPRVNLKDIDVESFQLGIDWARSNTPKPPTTDESESPTAKDLLKDIKEDLAKQARLSKVRARKVGQKVDGVADQVGGVGKKVDRVGKKVDGVGTKVDAVSIAQREAMEDLATLARSQDTLSRVQQRIAERMTAKDTELKPKKGLRNTQVNVPRGATTS